MEIERTRYDLAFSMGFSCGATFALREAGLQTSSYPLDWMGSPGLLPSARAIAGNFANWTEKGDFRLHDIRRGGLDKHIYLNVRTGFGFPHDFSSFVSFDEAYPEVRAKYDRRIARFLQAAGEAKRLLAVYVEYPVKRRASDAELDEARRTLAARFPQAAVDLLYFYEEPGVREPHAERPAAGIAAVGLDYREIERGQVMHTLDHRPIAAYLRAHVEVEDRLADAEKAAYAAGKRRRRDLRWGEGGLLKRWANRLAYRLYRKLEKRLVAEGLVPWEGPLWFVRVDEK